MSAELSAITTFAIGASVVSTLLGALTSIIGRRISKLKVTPTVEGERDYEKEVRHSLVSAILMREIDRCKAFRVASALLVFSQFVVGGVLTSSYVTKTLSEELVGLLGLVVLASSLINQHFRPDLLHKISSEKLRRLRTLKRKIEDQLYIITRGEPTDEQLIDLRLRTTEQLEDIEASEHKTYQNEKEQSA